MSPDRKYGFSVQDLKIDFNDLLGTVCSYFTYKGCQSGDQLPCKESIYVVLTDIKQMTSDQLTKIKELTGLLAPRVVYIRNGLNDLRLAIREPNENEVCGETPHPHYLNEQVALA